MAEVEVRIVSPADATGVERQAFVALVVSGGEVSPATLPGLVSKAASLAYGFLDKKLVGAAGMKHPMESYRDRVFKQAGQIELASRFNAELGWVFVSPEARGHRVATRMVESLIEVYSEANIFATSRVDNDPMGMTLKRFGFRRLGVPYPSSRGTTRIQLFVRP